MVQHRCEQEYYSYSYDAKFGDSVRKTTSLLRDYIENAEIVNERDVVLKTRYCYVLVPVPGATQWFNDEFLESSSEPEPKRVCVDGTEDSKEAELIQKFIAKFADDDCEDLKPNTVVDVYGILSKHNFEADPDNQFSNSNLPSLMNLHVMRYDFITDQVPERKFIKPIDDIRTVKAVLLQKLSAFLGDTSRDFCFANYFLFHLISSTYSRSGADLPICSMPLNVTGVRDETDSKRFIEGLNLLLSKVKLLPLSADYLSNARLNPRQNHSTGELEQGELQLANGTEVVADETNIQNRCQVSGNVEQNLKALNQLLTEQKLAYDFGVYQISFDVDLPFLILSPGISNLFRTPFPIHYFRENASSQGVSDLFGGSDALAMFRIYIQQAKSKVRLVNISEQTSKAIQNNFVEICQRLPAIEDKALLMQKLLIVSRFGALSHLLPIYLNW
ncbi:hypothetical protein WR25_05855 [Diploscapter pachys]|uniref:Mini-chromosome maintenance complex-binding protein n=1 Tax=Diploscapter pachys TaxID=2018661 RepID=A0A2A2L6S6_9BILA|nr:hypothetical protein WR25_05855 [Diploscapter pachys]